MSEIYTTRPPRDSATRGIAPHGSRRSAFAALFWISWRQQRSVVVVGALVAAFIPLALAVAGDEGIFASGKGKLGLMSTFRHLLPLILGVGFWPLWSALLGVQVFSSRRDRFLAERPVSSSKTWWARAAASWSAVLLLVGVSLCAWWLVAMLGTSGEFPLVKPTMIALGTGAVLCPLAWSSGIVAASFGATSLVASMAASLIVGFVLLMTYQIVVALPLAMYQGVPTAAWFLIASPIALAIASYTMLCRGEPSGTHRRRRGVLAIIAASFTIGLGFAAATPLAIRFDAYFGSARALTNAPAENRVLYIGRNHSAWLEDPASGKRLRFFWPRIGAAAWNDDGGYLALASRSSVMGRDDLPLQIERLDRDGTPIMPDITMSALWIRDLEWDGDDLLVTSFLESGATALHRIDPEDSSLTAPLLRFDEKIRWVLLKRGKNRWYVALPTHARKKIASSWSRNREPSDEQGFGLYTFDPETGAIGVLPIVTGNQSVYAAERGLSPSGRYWREVTAGPSSRYMVRELETGRRIRVAEGSDLSSWRWGQDDRLLITTDSGDNSAIDIESLFTGLAP